MSSKKTVGLSAFEKWPEDIKENYNYMYDVEEGKIVRMFCKVCTLHVEKIHQSTYRGKVVEDVVNYGKRGTTHILSRIL